MTPSKHPFYLELSSVRNKPIIQEIIYKISQGATASTAIHELTKRAQQSDRTSMDALGKALGAEQRTNPAKQISIKAKLKEMINERR